MTSSEFDVYGAVFDSTCLLSPEIKSIGGGNRAEDGGMTELNVLMDSGESWRLFAVPQAAAETAARLLEHLKTADASWELAVTRAADQLREALTQLFGRRLLDAEAEALPQIAEKILDRAAPRGLFAIAQKILADPLRYEHVVEFREDGWTIQHPVEERLVGSLFSCEFNKEAQLIGDVWANDSAYEEGRFRLSWQEVPGNGRTIRLDEIQ